MIFFLNHKKIYIFIFINQNITVWNGVYFVSLPLILSNQALFSLAVIN